MAEKPSTPESSVQYTVAELGQFIHLLLKRARQYPRLDVVGQASDLSDAQNYLDMIQARKDAGTRMLDENQKILTTSAAKNPILDDLPAVETTDPVLPAEKLNSEIRRRRIEEAWENDGKEVHEPKGPQTKETMTLLEAVASLTTGLIVKDGKIVAISTQPGNRGYDPEAHKKQIRIFCDDKHIGTAHTADTEAGTLQYYQKNAQGRIETLSMEGVVVIRDHVPEG